MDAIEVPEITQLPELSGQGVLYTREDEKAYDVYVQALEQLLAAAAEGSV